MGAVRGCALSRPPSGVRAIDRVRASGCEDTAGLQPATQQTGSPLDRDLVTDSATGVQKCRRENPPAFVETCS